MQKMLSSLSHKNKILHFLFDNTNQDTFYIKKFKEDACAVLSFLDEWKND